MAKNNFYRLASEGGQSSLLTHAQTLGVSREKQGPPPTFIPPEFLHSYIFFV